MIQSNNGGPWTSFTAIDGGRNPNKHYKLEKSEGVKHIKQNKAIIVLMRQ